MTQFQLGRVVLEFDGDKTKLEAALKAAGVHVKTFKGDVEKADGSVKQLAGGLKNVAAAIGVSFTVGTVVNFTKKVFDAASAIKDQSTQLGFGAEAFQRYSHAAKMSGGSQDAFVRAASFLNDKLAEGDKSTLAALTRVGLKYDELRAMKPEQAFVAVANAVGRVEDPMLRVNVAQDLMGRAARQLLPGMIEGYEKLGASATVMSDETVDRLERAQEAWEQFGQTIVAVSGNMMADALRDAEVAVKGYSRLWQHIKAIARDGLEGHRNFMNQLAVENAMANWKGAMDPREFKPPTPGVKPGALPVEPSKEAKAAADRIADLIKRMTGAEATAKLKQLDQALAQIGRTGQRVADEQIAELVQEVMKLHREGGTIPPMLGRWTAAHLSWQTLGVEVNTNVQEITESIRKQAIEVQNVIPIWMQAEQAMRGVLVGAAAQRSIMTGLATQARPVPASALRPPTAAFGTALGIGLTDGLKRTAGTIGETVLAALTGGGDVSRSIGAAAGLQIGTSLMERLGDTIDDNGKLVEGPLRRMMGRVGSVISSLIPGIGTILGQGLGALISRVGNLLFGPSELQRVREARAEWVRAAGGIEKLNQALKNVAGDPAVRAAWNDLFNAKKLKDYEAALARFNAAVADAQDALNKRLAEEADAREFLQATIEKYGFTVDQLGDKWKQQALTDQATLLIREYTALTASGIAHNLVVEKMGKNLNEFFLMALKTGAEVPEQLRPLLRSMIEQGTLLDENGEAFDLQALDAVNWSRTLTENIQAVIAKLDELIRAITDRLGKAIEEVPPLEIPFDATPDKSLVRRRRGEIPSFDTGSRGFRDFGPGTLAMLHGVEAVVRPQDLAGLLASARQAGTSQTADLASLAAAVRDLQGQPRVALTMQISAIDGADVQRFVESRDFAESLERAAARNTSGVRTAIRKAVGS